MRIRLLAVTAGLLAAGAAVIGLAGVLVVRGSLLRQADQQLRGYADRLASRPFVVTPFSGVGPGVSGVGPGVSGVGPGVSGVGPGVSGVGPGGFSAGAGGYGVDVLGSGGQLVLRTGLDGRSGPIIPPVPARTAARPGQLTTVPAAGGARWRVIAEPIRYRARRIPFGYSAEDFALLVTGRARAGLPGTLVVGLDLRGVDRAVGRLGVIDLALGGLAVLAVLIVGWLGSVLARRLPGLPAGRQA